MAEPTPIDARVPGRWLRCAGCGCAVFAAQVMLSADGPGVGIVQDRLVCSACGEVTER